VVTLVVVALDRPSLEPRLEPFSLTLVKLERPAAPSNLSSIPIHGPYAIIGAEVEVPANEPIAVEIARAPEPPR
jgi:hypothetical protein